MVAYPFLPRCGVAEKLFQQQDTPPLSFLHLSTTFNNTSMLFPGPQRKSKRVVEERIVEFQRGRLALSEAQIGTHEATRINSTDQKKQTSAAEFTIWNHPTIPLGFAAAKSRVEFLVDNVLLRAQTIEWTIEDFGADAKSAMPENN